MLVTQQLITLPQLIDKLTASPAAILGLNSGSLSHGAAADICIFDPDLEWQLNNETCTSAGKNTPFMGSNLIGRVTHTLVDGKLVYQL